MPTKHSIIRQLIRIIITDEELLNKFIKSGSSVSQSQNYYNNYAKHLAVFID